MTAMRRFSGRSAPELAEQGRAPAGRPASRPDHREHETVRLREWRRDVLALEREAHAADPGQQGFRNPIGVERSAFIGLFGDDLLQRLDGLSFPFGTARWHRLTHGTRASRWTLQGPRRTGASAEQRLPTPFFPRRAVDEPDTMEESCSAAAGGSVGEEDLTDAAGASPPEPPRRPAEKLPPLSLGEPRA
jgi:hypothetical protein